MAKLKVYRTPIGFHDAYVAAPSQKAALAAWGADADLFARGQAELVEDAALTAAPLARPGQVVRVVRGTAAEHLGALADEPPRSKRRGPATAIAGRSKPRKSAAPPRPSHAPVETAEAALAALDRAHREAMAGIRREEAKLANRKRRLEADHLRERERLRARVDAARDAWRDAIAAWRDAAETG